MFGSEAIKYYEKSLPVLPLVGKAPKKIPGWSRYCEHPVPENLQDEWISKHDSANIGLCMGPESGLVAVDIDDDSLKHLCPPSPVVKAGLKAETRFFKYTGVNKFKLKNLKVDFLSLGTQTVLPPSIHPDTNKPYRWLSPDTLLNFDIEDLPELPKSFFTDLEKLDKSYKKNKESIGRHLTLLQMIGGKVKDKKPIDLMVEEIYQYDLKVHQNHANGPYFHDKSEAYGRGRDGAKDYVESVIKTECGSVDNYNPLKIVLNFTEPKKEYRIKYPKFRGIAQEIFQHIYTNSDIPRSRMAVAATLSTIGTVLSNKVSINNRAFTNMYNLMVLESGGGKNYPLRFPAFYLKEAGCRDLVGFGAVGSETALIDKLSEQPVRIDTIDEATKLFMAGKATGSSAFQQKIIDILNDLWTAPGKQFYGKKNAGKEPVGDCFSPCLNIISATTPEGFNKSFSESMFVKGLGSRFMIFFDDKEKYPDENKTILDFDTDHISTDMRLFARKWNSYSVNTDPTNMNLTAHTYHLPASDKVKKELIGIRKEIIEKLKINRGDHVSNAMWKRFEEHFFKILIIDTCSQQFYPDNISYMPSITMDNVHWAYDFVDRHFKMQKEFLDLHLQLDGEDRRKVAIENLIRECKNKGATKKSLTRKLYRKYGFGERDREQIYYELAKAGAIIEQVIDGRTVFFHTDFIDTDQ